MIQTETVTIPGQVHGYPQVAFGGYVAGLLARRVGTGTTRVDFRRAVPVGTTLLLPAAEPGHAVLTDRDGTLLVQAGPGVLDLSAPPAPSWSAAQRATAAAIASPKRQVTDCFGCGVECADGHGLRLFTWPVPDRPIVAGAWIPDSGLADAQGELPPEIIWSALDCPGGFAAWVFQDMALGAVTAALTARVRRPVFAGERYLVHGWAIRSAGRKHTVGVAVSTPGGELCALAEALWVAPRDAAAQPRPARRHPVAEVSGPQVHAG
ncbi:PaaI family thioesterase [Nocardia rhizosphaerae]|uniref:PaaI family thioesterase n=1 Tax=Nocardia rhizosphaerae TaxID=1691571 RepID=A0ABV8L8V6_9NOCA